MRRTPRALTLAPSVRPVIRSLPSPLQYRAKSHFIHRTGQDAIKAHTVRFVKPSIFSWRRILYKRLGSLAVYGGAVYVFYHYLSPVSFEIIDEDEEHQGHGIIGQEEEEGEAISEEDAMLAQDDSWFIPLTTPQQLPREYYRGSDPEWQEFRKIAKDAGRRKQIMDGFVRTLQPRLAKHPLVRRLVGRDANVGKFWLDILFPDGPPPQYLRGGIELGDGFVAWSYQKIEADSQRKINRVLWPASFLDSWWTTNTVMAGIHYRRLMQALGFQEKNPFSPEERFRTMKEVLARTQARDGPKTVGSAQTDPHGSPDAVLHSTASSSAASRVPDPDAPWYARFSLPSTVTSDSDLAMNVFYHTMAKSWDKAQREPPRGTIVLRGVVEVRGDSGTIMFDVLSWYDPKTSAFSEVSAAIRHHKKKHQTPRGGA